MKSRNPVAFALVFLLLTATCGSGAESKPAEAWDILHANVLEKSAEKRAQAILVLGLLPGDSQALTLAQKAAQDENPEVRAASATALGQLRSKSSLEILRKLLSDPEPSVALAAASALTPQKDPAAYETYYEFLTGQRKTKNGLIAEQMKTLKDPKKMAALGIEQGVGFIPFAGIGLSAFKALRVDDVSPVRAAAAKMLASDPDSESGRALVQSASDKSWLVRAAALEAIAKRGDPQLLNDIVPAMMDDNTSVRCMAAAAVIRLSTLASAKDMHGRGAGPKAK